MGYAKYSEDIQEIKYENESKNQIDLTNIVIQKTYIKCPYCNFESTNQEDIEKHIRHNHNIVSAIVIINGKILYEDLYINDCYEAYAISYSDRDEIFLNGKAINFSYSKKIDITKNVNTLLQKEKKIVFSYSDKKFLIYKISKEDIDDKLIKEVVHRWNCEIKVKSRFTPPSSIDLNINSAEKEILNGIYNYYVGCRLKPIEIKDKENRYKDAYNMLINYIFISPISLFIVKIIALTFNWYDRFVKLSAKNNEDFFDIYNFILGNDRIKTIVKTDNNNYVYIDDDIEEVINLISLYQNKIQNYKQIIEENDETKYNNNINIRDIICWLKARLYLNIDKNKSKYYYDEIKIPSIYIEKDRAKVGV